MKGCFRSGPPGRCRKWIRRTKAMKGEKMEQVWIVFESSFKCSSRPRGVMGVFSTKEKACAACEADLGAVVGPIEVDRVSQEKKFVPDH
jgi:hypothetical protein